MEKYTHYGVEVVFQSLAYGEFMQALRTSGADYVVLPVFDDFKNLVVKYTYDGGTTKYAYIQERGEDEYVYATEQIPDDMDWDALVADIERQKKGEEPAQMPTKARKMYDAAERLVLSNRKEPEDPFSMPEEISEKELNLALLHLGIDLKELKQMEHWDVPEIDD